MTIAKSGGFHANNTGAHRNTPDLPWDTIRRVAARCEEHVPASELRNVFEMLFAPLNPIVTHLDGTPIPGEAHR